jgi:transketolase
VNYDLTSIAKRLRIKVIEMSNKARTPHLGSSLSCVDIVVAAYWGGLNIDPSLANDPGRDRFILSKGHAATTLYAALWMKGLIGDSDLASYARPGARLPEHPVLRSAPGIEATTGSLGHGLGIGCGIALAGRIQRQDYRALVVLSDGECNEGSVWEAALFAPAHHLENLAVVIDCNGWQATGRSFQVTSLEPLRAKWETFGWSAHEVDGHNIGALTEFFQRVPDGSGKPVVVVARTVKGKGVSFMEDDNNWHYRIPNDQEVAQAIRELAESPETGSANPRYA